MRGLIVWMDTRSAWRLGVTTSLALGLLGLLSAAPGWAEQVLKSPRQRIKVDLMNDLRHGEVMAGTPFAASVQEPARYKGNVLPYGTIFRGEVSKTKDSKHFNRPGYLVLYVNEVEFPTGEKVSLVDYKQRNTKVYNPDAVTLTENIIPQLPFTAINTAVSVSLRTATNISAASVLPINIGVRALTGAAWGLYDRKYRYLDKPDRIVYGINRGLGVIAINRFLDKLPAPDFRVGDTIPLYMDSRASKAVFEHAPPAQQVMTPTGKPTASLPASFPKPAATQPGHPPLAPTALTAADRPVAIPEADPAILVPAPTSLALADLPVAIPETDPVIPPPPPTSAFTHPIR
jgi:hypothetical protein